MAAVRKNIFAPQVLGLATLILICGCFSQEFADAASTSPEIFYARKYFAVATSKVSRANYEEIMLAHMLGDAHGHPLRGELRVAAEEQMSGLLKKYLDAKHNKDAYTLDDLYFDIIATRFQDWVERAHPDVDRKLEPIEPEELARLETEDSHDL